MSRSRFLSVLLSAPRRRSYDAIGPVMLSACISFLCGEIAGYTNTLLFLTALGLQAVGVVAIAVGA